MKSENFNKYTHTHKPKKNTYTHIPQSVPCVPCVIGVPDPIVVLHHRLTARLSLSVAVFWCARYARAVCTEARVYALNNSHLARF